MNFFSRRNQILLKELVKTDFKLRYQGSAIGYLWSVLKPLLLFLVMYMVFVRFLKFGAGIPHFAVALLLGITIWNFFMEATGMGMTAIVSRGDLLRKISFSKPILIISVTMNALINLLISLVVVIIFALINGVSITSWTIIFIPFLLVELVLFTLGFAFILATIFVHFRDIGPVWEVATQAGMYATPIIYPLSMVANNHKLIAQLMMLNPMAQIIQDFRHILIDPINTTVWQINPHFIVFVIPYILPFIIFFIGLAIFTKSANKFAEII